jgi:hypothetical protein
VTASQTSATARQSPKDQAPKRKLAAHSGFWFWMWTSIPDSDILSGPAAWGRPVAATGRAIPPGSFKFGPALPAPFVGGMMPTTAGGRARARRARGPTKTRRSARVRVTGRARRRACTGTGRACHWPGVCSGRTAPARAPQRTFLASGPGARRGKRATVIQA